MNKPNNACVFVSNKYRAVYAIEEVDAERKIWRGKPLPMPIKVEGKHPSFLTPPEHAWTYFSRNYNPDNDWDRYYPEFEITDEAIAGVPFLLVPIEKYLFGYEPPTMIALPRHVGGVN